MTTTKRGRAINGDLFTIKHPDSGLDAPFTTFADVSFRGVTHQAFAAVDRHAFNYGPATGLFTVAGLDGHIIEYLDHVETQVSHRYQALVSSDSGVLSVYSYQSVDVLLDLVGALGPTPTPLGLRLEPNDEVEFTSAPKVAINLDIGILEITPLTAEVNDELPSWRGTSVGAGELYGGQLSDESVYLTLVTNSCRAVALPAAGIEPDALTSFVSGLEASWHL